MKQTIKRMLSMLLVAVMLSATLLFPRADTIKSSAATTYPSNQTLEYNFNVLEATFGLIPIGGQIIEIISNVMHFEFYSGNNCIANNITPNDFPYYSSFCITKIRCIIDIPYFNPAPGTYFNGDLHLRFEISTDSAQNAAAPFYVLIENFDGPTEGYTLSYSSEIPVSAYSGLVQSGPVFPAGYDRNNDKYSFKNPSEKVSANIYSIVYGPIKGGYLALADSFGGPGLCYGMATTTAALLQNRNTINSFISSYANVAISEIAGLLPEYKSTELNMDLLTFMKYGHVAQYASDREANNGNLRGLYSAIKSYVNGTGFPVIISVWQKDSVLFRKNGHAILATGIRETDDAYMLQIDDSNFAYLTPELSISKDFSTWSYSVDGKKFSDGSSYSYSSANGIINYDTEGNTVYHLGKIAGQLSPSDYLKYNSILVVSSSEIIQNNNLTQVFTTSESDSGPEQSYNVYWADEDLHSIQLSTEYNENELTVADTYSSISIILDENETAEFYISDEDENSVAYYSDKNNNASITFATSNEQGENVITTISGTTNGGEVSASENAEGVNVSGLNDIFISVETKQGTASTSAKTTNGDAVNIIFNADKNTVKTDWQCQHIDVDQNYNCDICGAPVETPPAPETPDTPADDDNSCSCICHSENSIVQFFYVIFRFLWQLFGMNMDCACGVKHFDFYIFA